jgi:predicted transcriptional regulator
MKDHRITVRWSAEMRRRLKASARRSGTRESGVVRVAVELHLAAEEGSLTAYEHAIKAGLIGAVKGQLGTSAWRATIDLWTSPPEERD